MSAVDLTGVWLGADDVLTRCVARLLQSDLIVFKYYMCGACFSKFTRITTFWSWALEPYNVNQELGVNLKEIVTKSEFASLKSD